MTLLTFKLLVPHKRSQETAVATTARRLMAWVKANGYDSFSRWMAVVRVDEAKRVLTDHPDWSSETVADYCGFNSREYFQRLFKEQEGMTPTQFLLQQSKR